MTRGRLLTLTGVGGVGKSRLALRTGRQLERGFPDGVFLVELAPLNEPGLLPVAVGRGLGLGDERAGEPLRELAEHIGQRRKLLVLDNCEHLLSACAGLVAELLRACAGLRVLATSREPLRLEGEAVYQVPPLGLPDPGQVEAGVLAASDAVTLFVQRAQAALPGFELTAANREAVARLCRCLDGIPLAIELAAVRLRALGVEQIVERLEAEVELPARTDHSRPARQQTLRATMDWSHGFLAEPERVLWRRLSTFAGGFELAAAEQVCADPPLPAGEVLGALVGLVERSIVLREEGAAPPRYRLLETVQQYGRERLREAGEEGRLQARHREWCAAQAREARGRWWGPAQREVLDRLQAEHDNLRGALASCVQEPGQAAAGLAICADTWFFWNAQRHLREGRRWIETLLALAPDPVPARAEAQAALGALAMLLNDAGAAVPVLEEALALAEALGERATAVLASSRLGIVVAAAGDLERAGRLTEEALARARELHHPEALATVLSQAARVAAGRRDGPRAVALYRECIAVCRAADERWLRLRATVPLAVVLADGGDHAGAEGLMRESLLMARDLGDERMTSWSVEGLAWCRAEAGRAEDAARLLGAASALRAAEAASVYAADRRRSERCRGLAIARLGEAAFERAFRRGARLTPAQAVALALGEPAEAAAGPPRPAGPSPLSDREHEIAGLVADGLSNRDIAERLFISVRTAENHVSHVLVKLGLRSRGQLVRWVADREKSE